MMFGQRTDEKMPRKIKLLLPIFGAIALLFQPALAVYATGITVKAYMSAVAFNLAFFGASTFLFYSMWFWRYKTVKDEGKDAFRGAPALLGYFALFLGIPASLILSIINLLVFKSASPEVSLGPGCTWCCNRRASSWLSVAKGK